MKEGPGQRAAVSLSECALGEDTEPQIAANAAQSVCEWYIDPELN